MAGDPRGDRFLLPGRGGRAGQANPWAALDSLIAKIESDFAGRLLKTRDDLARWQSDPEGNGWALIGVEGFDSSCDPRPT